MDDLKKGYREGEANAKEAWRNHDGEDLADKAGNVGDEINKGLANAGDKARDVIDDAADAVDRKV
jgi:hypothetical protein